MNTVKSTDTYNDITFIRSNELLDKALALKPHSVVFDIFDTLIHRRVHPEDVKKLAAKRLAEVCLLEDKPSWFMLYGYRQQIEREICFENQAQGLDLEFYYPSFCQRYFRCLVKKGHLNPAVSSEQFCALMHDIELSVECSVQYVDNHVKDVIRQFHERGVTVFFLSDFYLPSAMLATMLSWHGVDGYYQEVVASSDYLETKRSGRLYKRFLTKLNLSADSLLMVGDNKDVDGVMARENGLKAFCIDRTSQHEHYKILGRLFAHEKLIEKKINSLFPKEKIFPELSLSLFCFIRKLYHNLVADGVRDVFFLSREGQPLQRMFEAYQKSIGVQKSLYIRSHYFLASRRSTFLPSLSSLENEEFSQLFRQYRSVSLRDFLLSLGLGEHLETIAQELSVDTCHREDDFPTSTTFRKLLKHDSFVTNYEKKRIEQRNCFLKYLEGFGVEGVEDGIVLVDVGWKGTIQDNIRQIVAPACSVSGYYLGMLAPGALAENNTKQGVLFSCLQGPTKGFFIFRDNTALFEVTLAADHGSVSHYEESEGCARGVLEDFVNDAPLYERVIHPLLVDLEARFEKICHILSAHPIDDLRFDRYVARKHARMLYFPRRSELNWFTSIYHRENFGIFGDSEFGVECRVPLGDRIKALYRLVRSPRSYLNNTFWPALKLKEAGLNFMIYPYNAYRMYRQLRKGEV